MKNMIQSDMPSRTKKSDSDSATLRPTLLAFARLLCFPLRVFLEVLKVFAEMPVDDSSCRPVLEISHCRNLNGETCKPPILQKQLRGESRAANDGSTRLLQHTARYAFLHSSRSVNASLPMHS